jgi:hypothetical protein
MSSRSECSSSSSGVRKRALLVGLKYDQPTMIYTHEYCKKVKEFFIKKFDF